MYLTYEAFKEQLDNKFKSGDLFFDELLENVIEHPERYCGLFRLSNAKTKLIQNVTQSREIKFGDFIEDITTVYLSKLSFTNLEKEIGTDNNGDRLSADQVFKKGNTIYLVEQKIRDDHDSTKKRGQFENFVKKIKLIKNKEVNFHLVAIMWFVDSGLTKNRNYYTSEINSLKIENSEIFLHYGSEFFSYLKADDAWNEILNYLRKMRIEKAGEIIQIPDFGKSEEIYKSLLRLPRTLWNKLLLNTEKYRLLREELFTSGDNLQRAKKFLGI